MKLIENHSIKTINGTIFVRSATVAVYEHTKDMPHITDGHAYILAGFLAAKFNGKNDTFLFRYYDKDESGHYIVVISPEPNISYQFRTIDFHTFDYMGRI